MRSRLAARLVSGALLAASSLALSGCGSGPDTEYGASQGASLNGTSVFAAMLARRGHKVRTAVRLTDALEDWAEGIVRFAPYPGPPARDEAAWYRAWLVSDPNHWLIYVVRDFDTRAEYWQDVRDGVAAGAQPARRAEAEDEREAASDWVGRLPSKARSAADPVTWFKVGAPVYPPRACTSLGGSWAATVDAERAALPLHEPLEGRGARVLTDGEDRTLVLDKSSPGEGRVLAIANGSFLLNEGLVQAARRPLALRVLDWAGPAPRRVALVEGSFVLAGEESVPGLWDLLKRLPVLRWIAVQVGLAALLASLARAPRLGRPRSDPPSGADRPVAHAEALGTLLAQSGDAEEAQAILQQYLHWRHARSAPAKTR
jgi:hypothetical protein